jgi:hypothetical protein
MSSKLLLRRARSGAGGGVGATVSEVDAAPPVCHSLTYTSCASSSSTTSPKQQQRADGKCGGVNDREQMRRIEERAITLQRAERHPLTVCSMSLRTDFARQQSMLLDRALKCEERVMHCAGMLASREGRKRAHFEGGGGGKRYNRHRGCAHDLDDVHDIGCVFG